jgi:hypothetical protein
MKKPRRLWFSEIPLPDISFSDKLNQNPDSDVAILIPVWRMLQGSKYPDILLHGYIRAALQGVAHFVEDTDFNEAGIHAFIGLPKSLKLVANQYFDLCEFPAENILYADAKPAECPGHLIKWEIAKKIKRFDHINKVIVMDSSVRVYDHFCDQNPFSLLKNRWHDNIPMINLKRVTHTASLEKHGYNRLIAHRYCPDPEMTETDFWETLARITGTPVKAFMDFWRSCKLNMPGAFNGITRDVFTSAAFWKVIDDMKFVSGMDELALAMAWYKIYGGDFDFFQELGLPFICLPLNYG